MAIERPAWLQEWQDEEFRNCARQIRFMREQRGWSQAKLGRIAHLATVTVAHIESPEAFLLNPPTPATLEKIAEAFDVGLDIRFAAWSEVRARHAPLDVPDFAHDLALIADDAK